MPANNSALSPSSYLSAARNLSSTSPPPCMPSTLSSSSSSPARCPPTSPGGSPWPCPPARPSSSALGAAATASYSPSVLAVAVAAHPQALPAHQAVAQHPRLVAVVAPESTVMRSRASPAAGAGAGAAMVPANTRWYRSRRARTAGKTNRYLRTYSGCVCFVYSLFSVTVRYPACGGVLMTGYAPSLCYFLMSVQYSVRDKERRAPAVWRYLVLVSCGSGSYSGHYME